MDQNNVLKNPRVIVIQKLYGHHLNNDAQISFPKHRYKKFIKDVVTGTIERKDLIQNLINKELGNDINDNKTEIMVKLMIRLLKLILLYPYIALNLVSGYYQVKNIVVKLFY